MDQIDQLLANNRSFHGSSPASDSCPSRAVAIVTCMDARLDIWGALGLRPGEAHLLRNAGGVITDDMIRSLAISQRRLGTRGVMIVQHSDCGMRSITDDGFRAELEAQSGITPPFSIEAFSDLEESVRESVRRVQRSPFLLHTDAVRGFVYEVATHRLREVLSDEQRA